MGLPGWAVTDPAVIGDLTLLPRNGTFASPRVGAKREALLNVTNGGMVTGYVLHERETATVRGYMEIHFEIFADQIPAYKAIDSATHGPVLPFWLVPDSSNMADKIYGRLVDMEFHVETIKEGAGPDGMVQQRYRYVLRIQAEVEDQPLED